MAIKTQSIESQDSNEIVYPWVGRHVEKTGPLVLFHSQYKGIVVEAGILSGGAAFTVGQYAESWSMDKFKEFKGTIKLVIE